MTDRPIINIRMGGVVTKIGRNGAAIKNRFGLKVGDEILVPNPLGSYWKMKVVSIDGDGDEAHAETEGHTVSHLQFNKDDRECWISVSCWMWLGLQ
jgi:hypothetical protein